MNTDKGKLALFGGVPQIEKVLPNIIYIDKEEREAVNRVLDTKSMSGFVGRAGDYFLGGTYVREFEKKMCDLFQVKYAVGFNSASTALQASIAAYGIGPGDEVITSPYTMSATPSAILLNNAIPVFADISRDNFCLDPKSVEENITERTRAILVVNLFGGSADYDKILEIAKKHNLKVIEDNAQSIGAKFKDKYLGTVGDVGIFSFNVHKILQCGEGGVLVTNDEQTAFRAQLVRNHGEVVIDDLEKDSKDDAIIGSNYRLSEVHAAIAIEQLNKLEAVNKKRVDFAEYLSQELRQFNWIEVPKYVDNSTHVYYVYPFIYNTEKLGITRRTFAEAMKAENFPLQEGYTKPLYLMSIYQNKRIYPNSQYPFVSHDYESTVSYEKGICPVAERLYEKELLFTNIHNAAHDKQDIDNFIFTLKKIENSIDQLREYEKKK